MQELIKRVLRNGQYIPIELQEEMLEKEKEQIIDFAYKILETSHNHQNGYCNVEEYYNQTYNQNKS